MTTDRNARARAKAEAITMPFFGPVTPGGWQHELIVAITAALLEFAGEERAGEVGREMFDSILARAEAAERERDEAVGLLRSYHLEHWMDVSKFLRAYDARRASPTASEAREQPVCRRICVLAVQGGDRDGPHDLDYCDLWEASEIGTPCAGLCHGDPRQPFDGICPRCGTHGNDGESCKVCEPPTASEVQQSREGAAARAELSRVSAEGAGGPPPPLSEVKCDGSGWLGHPSSFNRVSCPGCPGCRKERP